MKFAQDSQDEGYVITAYENDSIFVNGKEFNQSLIITSTQLNDSWNLDNISLLTAEHIQLILAFEPELIIIGTGSKLVFPPLKLTQILSSVVLVWILWIHAQLAELTIF